MIQGSIYKLAIIPNFLKYFVICAACFHGRIMKRASFATTFAKASEVKESYGGRRERCRSGLTGPPGKRVCLKRVPGVRIPLSPPLYSESIVNKVFTMDLFCLHTYLHTIFSLNLSYLYNAKPPIFTGGFTASKSTLIYIFLVF